MLTDLADTFGADRPAALCRELTKTYEEVLRRPLGELARWATEGNPRGEITLVVAGAPVTAAERPDDDTLRAAVAEREAAGRARRDAITDVATEYALRRRDVYTSRAQLTAVVGVRRPAWVTTRRPGSRR